jgi:hypothetical protein
VTGAAAMAADDMPASESELAEFRAWKRRCEMGPAPESMQVAPVGWHGLRCRTKYTAEDWGIWGQLGDTARIIDVEVGSPAWHAGLRNGTWVTLIDGIVFELFAQRSPTVGAVVEVKAWREGIGHFSREVTLVQRPAQKRTTRRAAETAKCGVPVRKDERPKWSMRVAENRDLRPVDKAIAMLLVNKFARGSAAFPAIATIADILTVSTRTVDRGLDRLSRAGFLRIVSGKKIGRPNHYTVTWPVSAETNVTPLRS